MGIGSVRGRRWSGDRTDWGPKQHTGVRNSSSGQAPEKDCLTEVLLYWFCRVFKPDVCFIVLVWNASLARTERRSKGIRRGAGR